MYQAISPFILLFSHFMYLGHLCSKKTRTINLIVVSQEFRAVIECIRIHSCSHTQHLWQRYHAKLIKAVVLLNIRRALLRIDWSEVIRFLDPVSISKKTSFRKISSSLEAVRFVFSIVRSLWNLTGTSKRYDNLTYQSRGFETSRDLTVRRLFGYWDGALGVSHYQLEYYILSLTKNVF